MKPSLKCTLCLILACILTLPTQSTDYISIIDIEEKSKPDKDDDKSGESDLDSKSKSKSNNSEADTDLVQIDPAEIIYELVKPEGSDELEIGDMSEDKVSDTNEDLEEIQVLKLKQKKVVLQDNNEDPKKEIDNAVKKEPVEPKIPPFRKVSILDASGTPIRAAYPLTDHLRPSLVTDSVIMHPRHPGKILVMKAREEGKIALIGYTSEYGASMVYSALKSIHDKFELTPLVDAQGVVQPNIDKKLVLGEGFMGYPSLNTHTQYKKLNGPLLGMVGFADRDKRRHSLNFPMHMMIKEGHLERLVLKERYEDLSFKFCSIFNLLKNNIEDLTGSPDDHPINNYEIVDEEDDLTVKSESEDVSEIISEITVVDGEDNLDEIISETDDEDVSDQEKSQPIKKDEVDEDTQGKDLKTTKDDVDEDAEDAEDLCDLEFMFDHLYIVEKFYFLMMKKGYINEEGTELAELEELKDKLKIS